MDSKPIRKRTVFCCGCLNRKATHWDGFVASLVWGPEYFRAGWCNECTEYRPTTYLESRFKPLLDNQSYWGYWVPETQLEDIPDV